VSAAVTDTPMPDTPKAGNAILELLNVESSYGPVQALRGVSLTVVEGKIATVLGGNGAGKSTILKTISGIIDPNKGQIKFSGAEIGGWEPDRIVRAGISHVPEGREVFPLLSVEDNLKMGAYTRSDRDGVAQDMETVYAYFPILVQPDCPLGRDELYRKFRERKVFVRRYFYPLISDFPMYRGLPSATHENLPVAHKLSQQILCLPIYPELGLSDVDRVVAILKDRGA